MKQFIKRVAVAAVLASPAMASIASASVVYNATGSNNCFPFACGPMDYEQVYAGSQFGSGPVSISGIRFKSAQDGTGNAFSATPVTLDITFSTTSTTPGLISGNFAVNLGTNAVQVFSGTAIVSSSGANVFDIAFPLTTNYAYDPSAGNLLVHLDVHSSQPGIGQFEAGVSPLIGRAYQQFIPLAHPDYGLATEFQTVEATVPEPATLALTGFACLGIVATRRRSSNCKTR